MERFLLALLLPPGGGRNKVGEKGDVRFTPYPYLPPSNPVLAGTFPHEVWIHQGRFDSDKDTWIIGRIFRGG